MTTLEKLEALHNLETCTLYDIMFRNAGVGMMFYYPEKVPNNILPEGRTPPKNWEQGLSVQRYYPTFEECVDAEYARLVPRKLEVKHYQHDDSGSSQNQNEVHA